MDGMLAFMLVLFYAAIIVVNVMLVVKVWRACNAALETRNQIRDMSFRDTARYISEVRRGVISEDDQAEAKEAFGIN